MPKEKIEAACSKNKYINEKNKSEYDKKNINDNIIPHQNITNIKSQGIKMEVETQNSNDLIASNSTKYSNKSKLSVESSNQISYNTSFFILLPKIILIYPIMSNKIRSILCMIQII